MKTRLKNFSALKREPYALLVLLSCNTFYTVYIMPGPKDFFFLYFVSSVKIIVLSPKITFLHFKITNFQNYGFMLQNYVFMLQNHDFSKLRFVLSFYD